MEFKYPFYIKDADPEGVAEVWQFLRPFYDRYPTGKEVGEALHQIRRELDLIPKTQEKKHDKHNGQSGALPAPDADTERHKKPVRRRRNVADLGTGSEADEQ